MLGCPNQLERIISMCVLFRLIIIEKNEEYHTHHLLCRGGKINPNGVLVSLAQSQVDGGSAHSWEAPRFAEMSSLYLGG